MPQAEFDLGIPRKRRLPNVVGDYDYWAELAAAGPAVTCRPNTECEGAGCQHCEMPMAEWESARIGWDPDLDDQSEAVCSREDMEEWRAELSRLCKRTKSRRVATAARSAGQRPYLSRQLC